MTTNIFYECGAIFNKWAALEMGFDVMGRKGWICIMDADILWPRVLPNNWSPEEHAKIGELYTPRRRIVANPTTVVPAENTWEEYPYHHYQKEWSGYTQIFSADDPVLTLPWYETNWKHAAGGDSFFQFKWKPEHKLRPPFEVLHLGPDTANNWCGRSTPYLNGTSHPEAEQRRQQVTTMLKARRSRRGDPDPFSSEKI